MFSFILGKFPISEDASYNAETTSLGAIME
jgi:hypothetical protein